MQTIHQRHEIVEQVPLIAKLYTSMLYIMAFDWKINRCNLINYRYGFFFYAFYFCLTNGLRIGTHFKKKTVSFLLID